MPSAFRAIFDELDSPVWIVTSAHDNRMSGLVATFVMKASIVDDEPRVLLGIARHHFTHELIRASGRLALHLLRSEQCDLAVHFGLQSGHDVSKLDGVPHEVKNSLPWPEDCAAVLVGEVEAQFDTGDRTLFLCRITETELNSTGTVLTMSRLLSDMLEEQRHTLKAQLQADADIDREAIRRWRVARPVT